MFSVFTFIEPFIYLIYCYSSNQTIPLSQRQKPFQTRQYDNLSVRNTPSPPHFSDTMKRIADSFALKRRKNFFFRRFILPKRRFALRPFGEALRHCRFPYGKSLISLVLCRYVVGKIVFRQHHCHGFRNCFVPLLSHKRDCFRPFLRGFIWKAEMIFQNRDL